MVTTASPDAMAEPQEAAPLPAGGSLLLEAIDQAGGGALDRQRTVMIGDSLMTDIAFGVRGGLRIGKGLPARPVESRRGEL